MSVYSAIYKIESISKPERVYIGSALKIRNRWNVHLSDLRKGIHHSLKLQNHFNKYGKDDLIFRIIEPCLPEFLTVIEDTYLHPLPYFNICPKAGSCLGLKHSEETKEKHRRYNPPSRKGISLSEETKQRMRGRTPWNKGKKTGLVPSTAFKKGEKVGEKNPFYGKHHSEESIKQNADAHIGQIPWNKGTKGVMKAWNKGKKGSQVGWNKGKHSSEEAKQNLRLAWVKRKLKKTG